ncbi:bifunctional GNAT family N-acetyltransferase/(deoxy)nucleoside triphosphate pyrophosphohydrolase [Acetobacter sp. AN02]|uniref:bifunctional GNAT family N-acetyltransferase/(deoxy)nucleoside triphosphate pyrophosphohydrolase n=1 Tax=Acetobacter sp. AN02 TaxID=2894186 RepID=UPI0024346051|nr:bifunctional GNAT family N-acetyltransferase/(deoxy)nucleoside triphosphate pyrophosphohydrolase [Acetobacter sp. AN02]MDG6094532.1 bifunctional GNAT family N-acetyltransferase/(deoxy)nucleoside triphosphate pyrophosphohydrolase [Acetobacter sp. AN02]
MDHRTTLTAGDTILRAFRPSDAEAVHRLINDWSVVRMLSRLPFPYPRELADEWIAATIRQAEDGTAWHFALTDAQDRLLGCIGLTRISSETVRLGYWIGRPFWGRGLAKTCVQRVVSYAFSHLNILKIEAFAATDNLASIAVLRHAGLQETGTGEEFFLARNGKAPVLRFEADRSTISPAQAEPEEPDAPRRLLLVTAAALISPDFRVLLARRPEGKSLAGLWEFPGGKIDPGENPEQALIRELHEELGIDVTAACLTPLTFASHRYDSFDLLMPLYVCRRWQGTPSGREGQALAWVAADELDTYPMPQADLPLLPFLRDLL